MADPKNPKPGDLTLDLSDITTADVTPEESRALTKIRDGLEEAVACLTRLQAGDAQLLGLNAADLKTLGDQAATFARLTQVKPAVEKLAELIDETHRVRGHQLNLLLGEMANQARRRGERDPKAQKVMGSVQPLLDYQFGPAERSAVTRARSRDKDKPKEPSK